MQAWRARLGFLIPSQNPTVEREMVRLLPEGVSAHYQRMVARGPVGTLENLQARAASHLANMDETVEMIANVEPDVIVLAHTATSYALGREGEAKLAERIETMTGIPFISALGSAIAAFQTLGIRRVAVGTAYDKALTLRGKAVLEEHGIEVVAAECLLDVRSIFEESERRVYGLARSVDCEAAEAVFLSGVGLPTVSLLGALEADLDKPVMSSVSAMTWNALRIAGVATPVAGFGRLLAEARYRPPSARRRLGNTRAPRS